MRRSRSPRQRLREEHIRAWRFYGFGDMRLDELPDPSCGPDDVLLRVRVVQPSVTESILATGGETLGIEIVRAKLEHPPVALFGHEYCADVVEAGANVHRLRPGDRVADISVLPCFECALCAEGRTDDCRRGPMIGWDVPGCLCDYAVMPEHGLVALPPALSDHTAAALQPAADCVAGVESAGIEPGDVVVVLGQGTMGLYSLQLARHALAGRVVAVDVRPEPLALARSLGADECLDASETDAADAVLELTGGRGADVVVECSGGPSAQGLAGTGSIAQAFRMVRDSGRIVVNSLIPEPVPIEVNRWRIRSVSLLFPPLATRRHLKLAADMAVQGRLRIEPLVSHVVRGLEHVPRAFEITADKRRFGATGPCQVVVATDVVAERGPDPQPAAAA
jgi:threonine dehydrogenase-like Zn-dependent dehydrogenase